MMETNVIHATEEFLRSEITKRDEQINRLTSNIASSSASLLSASNALQNMTGALQEWTVENLENGSINDEQALELSEIGGFDLTKEVEAEVTVKYWITLQVPAGESAEDILNDIDFDAVTYDVDTITHISSSVESIDI